MNASGYKDPTAETAIANVEKPWRDMTEAEIYKTKKEKCRFCRYSSREGMNEDNIRSLSCDYIGKIGHSRGCRPDKCDKFEKKTKKRRKKHE